MASRYDQPANTTPTNPWDKGAQSGGFEYQPKVMPTAPAPVPTAPVQMPAPSTTPEATPPVTLPSVPPAVAETPVPAAPDIPALPPAGPGANPIASPTETYKTNFKTPETVSALEQLAQQTGGDYFSSGFTGTNPADALARRTGTDTLMHTTTGPEAPSSLDEFTDMKSDPASLPSSTTSALEALSAESNLGRNPLSNMVGGDANANTTINGTAPNQINIPDVGMPATESVQSAATEGTVPFTPFMPTKPPLSGNTAGAVEPAYQDTPQDVPGVADVVMGNIGRVEDKAEELTNPKPPEPDATTEVVNSVAQEAPTIGAPVESPTNQEYKNILAGLDTSVFDQEYQQGLQQLRNQLGTGMNDLSEEMSARGLGSSGQYVQGASELNAAAMTQANQLATAMQKQKIDAKLQELNSIVAMRGGEMDDATKREIANQTAELEQQKINLASQDQEFQQKQQAIDTAQAIAYNLANMGYTDQEANDLIAQALAEVGDGATADQIWQAIINKLAETTSGLDQSKGGYETAPD